MQRSIAISHLHPRAEVRWLYMALAVVCIALGLIGVVLPGLPTTPFLLLAAWASSRGSARVHDWLHNHPSLGPPLRQWQEQRAIPVRAKCVAILMLIISWSVMAWRAEGLLLPVAMAVFFACVATYLLTRPNPREPEHDKETCNG